MRAVVIEEPNKIAYAEVPDPAPGPRDVIVAVSACGICGTDIHILQGEFEPTPYPIIPGHEFTGTIAELGREVTGLHIGDHVAVDPSLHCGECAFCAVGKGNLCERWGGIGNTVDGAAAEYVKVPARNCHVLPSEISVTDAALIEPLSCAVRGYDLLPRQLGSHYLIYGAGTMGLMMAQLAPRAGAASVSVVDPNTARLEVARRIDVDAVATHADELVAGRPGRWDVVIDCTGVPAAIEDGLTRVRRGGTFQQFGVAPAEASAAFSPFRVYNDEVTIVGSMAVLHSFGRAVELFRAGAIDAELMISHTFALSDYEEAVATFRAGTGRKLQVRPH